MVKTYKLNKYADNYHEFYNSFYGDSSPETVAMYEECGIGEDELSILFEEWNIAGTFPAWIADHFVEA